MTKQLLLPFSEMIGVHKKEEVPEVGFNLYKKPLVFSIEGEGYAVGTPTLFLRLQGCPFNCSWCDTKDSRDPAKGLVVDLKTLVEIISESFRNLTEPKVKRLCITGGEPLWTSYSTKGMSSCWNLRDRKHPVLLLISELSNLNKRADFNFTLSEVCIETSGILIDQDFLLQLIDLSENCEFTITISADIKPPSSGIKEKPKIEPALLSKLSPFSSNLKIAFKAVVDTLEDLNFLIENYHDVNNLVVTPTVKAISERNLFKTKEFVEILTKKFPPTWKIIPQIHKVLGVY